MINDFHEIVDTITDITLFLVMKTPPRVAGHPSGVDKSQVFCLCNHLDFAHGSLLVYYYIICVSQIPLSDGRSQIRDCCCGTGSFETSMGLRPSSGMLRINTTIRWCRMGFTAS